MRIGFDASAENGERGLGLGRAVRGLLAALERRGAIDVVRLLQNSGETDGAWRRRLARLARERGLDGLHTFDLTPAGRPAMPWVHTVTTLRRERGLRARLGLARLRSRATALVAPSRPVAEAIGGGATRVVPWGIDPCFHADPPDGTIDEVLLERFRLGSDPLLLCPAAVNPTHRLGAVLAAVRELGVRGRRVEVVVTGTPGRAHGRDLALASRLGLAGQVSTLGYVDDEELAGLYRLASAVPVLSRSAGFGHAAAEALASGTPALVPGACAQAALPGVTEVAADDPRAFADAIEAALATREAARLRLPPAVASFRWDSAAEAIEHLWRDAVGSPQP